MDKRLTTLEILAMEQENTIETLGQEVHKQQLQVQALELQVKYLMEKLDSISKEGELSSEVEQQDPPPPHY